MKHKCLLIILLFPLFISASCIFGSSGRQIQDYKSEGFLNDNVFQMILQIKPDDSAKGLVQKRENAQEKAKKRLLGYSVDYMILYIINRDSKKARINDPKTIPNYRELKKLFRKTLKTYVKNGYIAQEYFREDKSLIVSYRIYGGDLKADLESLTMNMGNMIQKKIEAKHEQK
ncbi:MAG: hypothetical protein MUD12_08500 [Spirochaetes bacterium]|jgi:hypothetical protein|nr:hypothetical protein [Spirochaetota bacterium]